MSGKIKDTAAKLAEPILEEMNLELVDVEYKKEGKNWFLRLFIDGEDGVDIEECGKVSEQLSEKLDEEDPIQGMYYLEVSSPGAERPLKNASDIQRSIGKHVYVTTYEAIDGDKAFEGCLQDFDGDTLTIEGKVKQKNVVYKVPYDKVAKARLAVQF
ncbi:ribosome maturation factor RimP [Alteribacillus persepolensis]|uniref:Ribosome maturation factor RimP n=1 Tax=Alteribacillus persepolensis TaxID=568899 RepID=A0A1G7YRU7_9BACI|nr:ribosome maturation factor RimP [Alteribacillus persepolensis]SDG99107.1 ribosome maturation factor RimP [Alteribacillus persepolensis]